MIFVGTHHKTGSVLFYNVFSGIAKALSLHFYSGPQSKLPPGAQIWFSEHSLLYARDFTEITGLHVIRHPLEVICSAYRYHLVCKELWCIENRPSRFVRHLDLGGLTYQERLRSLPLREGILFEMRGASFATIMDMYRWNYADERFLNVKLEDTAADFDATFARIFSFLGVDEEECLPLAIRHDVGRTAPEQLELMPHVTNKSRRSVTWPEYFSDGEMLDVFRLAFPADLLQKLNYPPPKSVTA